MGCGVIVQPQLFGFEGLQATLQAVVRLRHSAHLLARLLQTAAAGSQTALVDLDVGGAEPYRQGLAAVGAELFGKGQGQFDQVGRSVLDLELAGCGRFEQLQWHEAGTQPKPDQLHIDSMGQVAKAPGKGRIEVIDPGQQSQWVHRHQPIVAGCRGWGWFGLQMGLCVLHQRSHCC